MLDENQNSIAHRSLQIESDELRKELVTLWKDIQHETKNESHKHKPNVVLALSWCRSAEKALTDDKPALADARFAIGMGLHELARAKELRGYFWFGVLAAGGELIELLILGWIIWTQTWTYSQEEYLKTIFAWLPAGGFVWGALGAIVWALFYTAYYTKRSLFNYRYIPWHLTMPFIGAVTGAILSAIAVVGLAGISLDLKKEPSPVYTLVLLSFLGGLLSQKTLGYLRKLADKYIPGSGDQDESLLEKIQEKQ